MKNLYLSSGEVFAGTSFGADQEAQGEVVFTTGMTGYLETLTDPSYYGQIVIFTFPLIGNYGVPDKTKFLADIDKTFESNRIWVRGVILMEESAVFSHEGAKKTFQKWLQEYNIPALSGVDTRALTQILREQGTILGAIADTEPKLFSDRLNGRFVPEVSPTTMEILEPLQFQGKTVAFLDCGAKNGIFRNFLDRGVRIIRLPFDQDPYALNEKFDGLFISNGPGDPATCTETIEIVKKALDKGTPTFGICLGNQILALAAGAKTRKMKYGHRGVNQPAQDLQNKKCIVTTQNHGFEVDADSLPSSYEVWFQNLNDQSVEGIRHKEKPYFSVQFHPEACAGPEDAQYLFDEFVKVL